MSFYKNLNQALNMNFISISDQMQTIMNFNKDNLKPYNSRFEEMGYSYRNFLINLGSLMLPILIYIVSLVLLVVVKIISHFLPMYSHSF